MQYIDSLPQFFKKGFMYLFMAVLGFHRCSRTFSSCRAVATLLLWRTGFSLRWLLLVAERVGSRHLGCSSCGPWARCGGLRALELWFSSCGTWAGLGYSVACVYMLHISAFCTSSACVPAPHRCSATPISWWTARKLWDRVLKGRRMLREAANPLGYRKELRGLDRVLGLAHDQQRLSGLTQSGTDSLA